jgi:adenylate cyclase
MRDARRLWLKNAMLVGNLFANLFGLLLVRLLMDPTLGGVSEKAWDLMEEKGWMIDPLVFALLAGANWIYELPMRRVIDFRHRNEVEPPGLLKKARKRMLNEPFFLMSVNFCMWIGAYFIYNSLLQYHGIPELEIEGGFLRSVFSSLIAVILAFFAIQSIQQRWLSPFLFPEGHIHQIKGAIRIRIATRLTAMLFACNIVPLIGLLHLLYAVPLPGMAAGQAATGVRPVIVLDIVVFMVMGIWVTVLVTKNFTRPLKRLTKALQAIRKGDLDQKVRVTTNDEIGYSGEVVNEMVAGLKERDLIRETFGKYVSTEIRDEILSGRIPLDGEAREVTVLFADIRNFTPMVESTPPKEVVGIINQYFEEMENAVHRHKGLVLQYIGDEIEAVFGAPVAREGHARDAVAAAMEMRDRLRDLNRDLKKKGKPTLSHGIGIHTGRVVAANIGSPSRLSYALVGDTVNLASRLQGLTREFDVDIIFSEATQCLLNGEIQPRKLPPTKVKGKRQPVSIYAL